MKVPDQKVDNVPVYRKLWNHIKPQELSSETRKEVVDGILEGAFATRRFYVLLSLSTSIAALGLLANSTAVIIGAMIIAPLMGPILGLALGMVSANHVIERRSLLAEITGVILAIGIGYFIGLFPIHPSAGSEMLARTSPTIYDLGIALASGLAGGYASVNRGVNSALAGVAISVALVPPLATCGLFISMADWKHGLGAFMLFIANFFCIQTAAAAVFWVFRLNRGRLVKGNGIWIKFMPSIIAVIAMAWFMTGTLIGLVRGQQFESRFKKRLNELISQRTGGRLDQVLDRQSQPNGYKVVASALTPKVLSSDQVREIESDLESNLGVELNLVLRSVISQDMDRSGRVFYNDQDREQADRSRELAAELDKAKATLSEYLTAIPGANLYSLERSQSEDAFVFQAYVDVPEPIKSGRVAEMEDALIDQLDHPVRLVVRSALTTVTDRNGNLYLPEATPKGINQTLAQLKERITAIIDLQMAKKPARKVVSIDLTEFANILRIKAVIEATQPVRPEEIVRIQAELKKLDARAYLQVRTDLTSTADGSGWVR